MQRRGRKTLVPPPLWKPVTPVKSLHLHLTVRNDLITGCDKTWRSKNLQVWFTAQSLNWRVYFEQQVELPPLCQGDGLRCGRYLWLSEVAILLCCYPRNRPSEDGMAIKKANAVRTTCNTRRSNSIHKKQQQWQLSKWSLKKVGGGVLVAISFKKKCHFVVVIFIFFTLQLQFQEHCKTYKCLY